MSFTGFKEWHLYQLSSGEQEIQEVSENQLDERILIMGSGVLECLIAIDLAERGKEVVLVEKSDELLLECLASPKRAELMRKLEQLVVTIFLETPYIEVLKNQVCLRNQEGFETYFKMDNIIVSKKR
ncbi:hypothetical protein IGL98_003065 [Enterococcus sp. DIV0840]|uniref:NAD(P)/FAD-dependent oxidoreductase n=1 Tax=Enterococcus TaxID=1350 RepID=UPI001A8F2507|nr:MULTISPECIES: FAD/NAD(P)-binding oxidoreductase [Enterococcus]MBO0435988.1 NAD(P)/FAD-dependent oxidoreductase [Enterococcus sp. DIV0849a]MBO0473040.1 NAD(P)/FAD-dependent oxidoreductase [Enterococcus ureasiticus]